MMSMEPRRDGSNIRLVVSRHPVTFSEQEFAAVRSRFDRRTARNRWHGVRALGQTAPERVVFFADADECRYFTLTRYDDGVFELAGDAGRVLERNDCLERLLASFDRRCAVH